MILRFLGVSLYNYYSLYYHFICMTFQNNIIQLSGNTFFCYEIVYPYFRFQYMSNLRSHSIFIYSLIFSSYFCRVNLLWANLILIWYYNETFILVQFSRSTIINSWFYFYTNFVELCLIGLYIWWPFKVCLRSHSLIF